MVNHLLERGARPDSVCQHWRELDDLSNLDQWNAADEPGRYFVLHKIEYPSALRTAIHGGHGDVVEILLLPNHRLPADSLEYLRAILAAVQIGRLDLVDLLFSTIGKNLYDFEGFGNWMIFTAICYNQMEVVQILLNQGVDVNASTSACCEIHGTLAIAAAKGHLDMAKLLLKHGADVHLVAGHARKWPIQDAARNGHEEMVSLLIEHGVDPKRALWHAASGGQALLIQRLLDRHPDLLIRDGGVIARSALSRAVVIGNFASITVLVEAGVPLKEKESADKPFPTLVDHAKGLGPWVVDHLLSLGALDTDHETNVDPETVQQSNPQDAAVRDYIIVRAKEPLNVDQNGELQKLGVSIHEHLEDNNYLCIYKSTDLEPVRALEFVQKVDKYDFRPVQIDSTALQTISGAFKGDPNTASDWPSELERFNGIDDGFRKLLNR